MDIFGATANYCKFWIILYSQLGCCSLATFYQFLINKACIVKTNNGILQETDNRALKQQVANLQLRDKFDIYTCLERRWGLVHFPPTS